MSNPWSTGPGTNIFLTSDTHFGHRLLADGVLRPWTDPDEMTEAMIERWNAVVKPQDKVYHVGDVVINRRYLASVLPRLNGSKVLIKGNHDIFKLKDYALYFKDIRAYGKLGDLWLSHVPLHPAHLPRWCRINVHGHLHHRQVLLPGLDVPDGRYLNVCVERTDYRPLALEELPCPVSEPAPPDCSTAL